MLLRKLGLQARCVLDLGLLHAYLYLIEATRKKKVGTNISPGEHAIHELGLDKYRGKGE